MTDYGENYEYEFDGFGRLRKVKNTSTQALVSEYWYNSLGHRISWKYDTDVDGDVDADRLYDAMCELAELVGFHLIE